MLREPITSRQSLNESSLDATTRVGPIVAISLTLVVLFVSLCCSNVNADNRRRKAKLSLAERKEIRLQQNRVRDDSDQTDNEEDQIQSSENEEDSGTVIDCHLQGFWYNQHGSELYLNQSDSGKISGEFRTNVASESGIVGNGFADVTGSVCGNIFAFHVIFPQTKSIATWTGQCSQRCDFGFINSAATILTTSWTITTQSETCSDYWKSNRMGQDFFTRRPIKTGPRKGKGGQNKSINRT